MLDQLFETGGYYDFPSFEVALYSLLLAFVLSTIIALTYRITFQGNRFPNNFFQAMVLSSMVSSMVIMAVGNNLAAGFGIIGAIAIIRFRTNISDTRNIIFIFATLSVGIATGVYGYAIALAGTLIFCTVAVLLHFSPFGPTYKLSLDLAFAVTHEAEVEKLKKILRNKGIDYKTNQMRMRTDAIGLKYVFQIEVEAKENQEELFKEIVLLENYTDVRLSPSLEAPL